MKKLWKWIDHNQGRFVGLVLSVIMLIWVYGCPSTVISLIDPERRITREELSAELDTAILQLEQQIESLQRFAAFKFEDLDRQDVLKVKLAELALTVLDTGKINPIGIGILIAGLVGIGTSIDNRAKDKVIKTNNKNNKAKDG